MDTLTPESTANANAGEVRIIRIKELLLMCGLKRSSVYEMMKDGRFPKPIKLSGRASGWVKSEVVQWVEDCIKASRTER